MPTTKAAWPRTAKYSRIRRVTRPSASWAAKSSITPAWLANEASVRANSVAVRLKLLLHGVGDLPGGPAPGRTKAPALRSHQETSTVSSQHADVAAAERERLFIRHRDLVEREISRYRTWHIDRADLRQAGILGLLIAAARFDPAHGVPFGAYAHTWVRKQIQRAIAQQEFPAVLPPDLTGRTGGPGRCPGPALRPGRRTGTLLPPDRAPPRRLRPHRPEPVERAQAELRRLIT